MPPQPTDTQRQRGTRKSITVGQRQALRRHARENLDSNQRAYALWFQQRFGHKPCPTAISESLSKKFDHLDDDNLVLDPETVKARNPSWPELETALIDWYRRNEGHMPIPNTMLTDMAARFWYEIDTYRGKELPQFSNGWVERFKKRHGLAQRKNRTRRSRINEDGEQDAEYDDQSPALPLDSLDALPSLSTGSARRPVSRYQNSSVEPPRPVPRAFTQEEVAEQVLAAQGIASQFSPQDVYFCDETKLLWNQTPEGIQSPAQILIHLCCNADGSDKIPLWLIGTHEIPRAFQAAGVNTKALNCIWRGNPSVTMNLKIMREWLRWFDKRVAGRKVLLFMDTYSAHTAVVEDLQTTQQPLQNTLLYRLPPGSPSGFQPPDRGVFRIFKAHYRKRWLRFMIDQLAINRDPLRTSDVLNAVRWSVQAWQSISATTIRDCWVHSTLSPRPSGTATIAGADASASPQPFSTPEELVTPEGLETQLEVQALLDQLEQRSGTRLSGSIEDFLDPQEETIEDDLVMSRIDEIAAQYNFHLDQEPDEGIQEQQRISIATALGALETLRRFEEQQSDDQPVFIERLNEHENRLRKKEVDIARQASITALFTMNM